MPFIFPFAEWYPIPVLFDNIIKNEIENYLQ